MSQAIDWSKAPEGTTHAKLYSDGDVEFFRLHEDGTFEFFSPGGLWRAAFSSPEECVKRPVPTWNGEGPPPVGIDCEYRVGGGPWFKCNIRYVTTPYHDCPVEVVMFAPHLKGEQTGVVGEGEGEVSFRPIRTPEQIKRDEATDVWLDSIKAEYGAEVADKCETILISGGYRKPGAP